MWTLAPSSDLPIWRATPEPHGVRLAFSTRRGGVSAPPFETLNLGRSSGDRLELVEANRERLLRSLDLDPRRLATAGQVHGTTVTRVANAGLAPECDALVTTTSGLALAVTAADCLPILYHAPGAVAAAHSGWRGTAAGMPEAALAAVCAAAGVPTARVTAHFGPCIRGCCYEVGDEVAARFPAAALRRVDGRWRLDLPTAARARLLEAGLVPESLHDTGACTSCEPHWYYSYRRDHGRTGRLWGVVARVDESTGGATAS